MSVDPPVDRGGRADPDSARRGRRTSAYAEGKIQFEIDPKTKTSVLRYAPGFGQTRIKDVSAIAGTSPYTAEHVAAFAGWLRDDGKAKDKVLDALSALELIEEGILDEATFNDLSIEQARVTLREARRVKREREAEAKRAAEDAKRARREAEKRAKEREAAE